MAERLVTVTMHGVIRLRTAVPDDLIEIDVEGCLQDMLQRVQEGIGFRHPLLQEAQLEIVEFNVKVSPEIPAIKQ